MTRIAFIGVGNMGLPMVRNLLAAGHEVRAYDVSTDALAEAVQAGAGEATSLADAVTGVETVITMVPEGRHVRAVYLGDGGNDGILGHAPREALLADCSTIDIATAREVAATAAESGYEMIDAPVSGGVTGAAAGTLTFMVGGTAAGFERARPVLSAMGRNVVHLGGPGHGQATKICNNMMAGIAITAASPGSAGIYLPAADNKTDIYLPVADNKIDIARLNSRGPSARCGQDARAPRNGTTCLVGLRRSLASLCL